MSPKKRPSQKPRLFANPFWLIALGAVLVGAVIIALSWSSANQPGGIDHDLALAEELPALGNPDAPVVIDEYSDFQCPYCGQFSLTTFRQIEQAFISTGQVKFVFHNFAFIGAESQWAAEASYCAHEQGRFWEYHDVVFNNQAGENRGAFSKDNLKRFAKGIVGDEAAFNSCLDSERYAERVRQVRQEGTQRGVTSTPSFFINGKLLKGAQPFSAFQAQILAALNQ